MKLEELLKHCAECPGDLEGIAKCARTVANVADAVSGINTNIRTPTENPRILEVDNPTSHTAPDSPDSAEHPSILPFMDPTFMDTIDLHSVLDNLHESVVIMHKGCMVYVNEQTCSTFGYTKTELIGKNVSLLCPPDIAKKHDSYLHRFENGSDAAKAKSVISTPRKVEGMTKAGNLLRVMLSVSTTPTPEVDRTRVPSTPE